MSFAIPKVTISEAAMKTIDPTNATSEPTTPDAISSRFRFFCMVPRVYCGAHATNARYAHVAQAAMDASPASSTQPGRCAGLTFTSTFVANDARPRMTTSAEMPTNGPADS